jgi:hypothetical protein
MEREEILAENARVIESWDRQRQIFEEKLSELFSTPLKLENGQIITFAPNDPGTHTITISLKKNENE